MSRILLLGGAGFIGSRIAGTCVADGHAVTVIDGLFARTSGRPENLQHLAGNVDFVPAAVENVGDLDQRLAGCDVVIDCMGWTLHRGALEDPLHDMALNLASHVHWLQRLPKGPAPKILYLGSRVQYGDVTADEIAEDAPQDPYDVQGIHKAAAERHFRLAARLRELEVIALRLPACIGPNMPFEGEDIGLVGGFVRDAMADRPIRIFGRGRRRALAFVDDVAEVVRRLLPLFTGGFTAYNLRGEVLAIDEIARRILPLVGRGRIELADVPRDIGAIDSGAAAFSERRLREALGGHVPRTPLETALERTICYLREVLS